MNGPTPLCVACLRLRDTDDNLHCDAYPKAIPDQIVVNRFDHRRPYPGDRGICFEPINSEAYAWAEKEFGPLDTALTWNFEDVATDE